MQKNTLIHLISITPIYVAIIGDLLASTLTSEENEDHYPIHSPVVNKSEPYKALERVFQAEKTMLSDPKDSTGYDTIKPNTMQILIQKFDQLQPKTEIELHDLLSQTARYLTGFYSAYALILQLFKQELEKIHDRGQNYVDTIKLIPMDLTKSQKLSEMQEELLKSVVKLPIISEWLKSIRILSPTPYDVLTQGHEDGVREAIKEILNPNIESLYPGRYWYSEIMATRYTSLQILKPFLGNKPIAPQKILQSPTQAPKPTIPKTPKTKSSFSCICGGPQD
mgnify:CR=1 FL=1